MKNTITKKNIISTFRALCASAKSPEDFVRSYIDTFGEELKKFGNAKIDDMNQPMVALYNYIDSWEFRKDCEGDEWEFVDMVVTYAEPYIWHKVNPDCYEDDDYRIEWIREFL